MLARAIVRLSVSSRAVVLDTILDDADVLLARGADVPDRTIEELDAVEDRVELVTRLLAELRPLVGKPEALGARAERVARGVLQAAHDLGDIGGRRRRAVRERADLLGDHREPASVLARAGGLDARVEREQVRAIGDQVDRLHHVADLLGATPHVLHHARAIHHRLPDLDQPPDRTSHRDAAASRRSGDARGGRSGRSTTPTMLRVTSSSWVAAVALDEASALTC